MPHDPFPSVDFETWKAAAEKTLRGASFEDALVGSFGEGLPSAPLYTQAPAGERIGTRRATDVQNVVRLDLSRDEDLATRIESDRRAGVDGFLIEGAPRDTDATAPRLTAAATAAGDAWLAWDAGSGFADARERIGNLPGARVACVDPLGCVATRRDLDPAPLLDGLAELGLASAAGPPPLLLRADRWADAGADAVLELGLTLAAAVDTARALETRGLSREEVGGGFGFRVATGRDVLAEIAKLRALRTGWARVLAALELPPRAPWILAVGSARTPTLRDPWTNLLRSTAQTFAAIVGGADAVSARAHDDAAAAPGVTGRRLARNLPAILRDECHLADVLDPSAGSYAIESLTETLARAAWDRFREIERAGGFLAVLRAGDIDRWLEEARRRDRADTERGDRRLLGVTIYENPDDEPLEPAAPTDTDLPAHREASDFEAEGARP